jgi:hypothetical protein
MLSQAIYWSTTELVKSRDGWFYKSWRDWEAETCLTRREQDAARVILRRKNFIATETRKVGGAPTLHYRVNFRAILEALAIAPSGELDCTDTCNGLHAGVQTRIAPNGAMDCPDSCKPITESTSETTTETTADFFPAAGASGGDEPGAKGSSSRETKGKTTDPRFAPAKDHIRILYQRKYGQECTWSTPENANLSRWLRDNPAWPLDQILKCVENVFASERDYGRPSTWLNDLGKWVSGPKNEFGNTKGVGNVGKSSGGSAQAKQDRSFDAIRTAASRMAGSAGGAGEGLFSSV